MNSVAVVILLLAFVSGVGSSKTLPASLVKSLKHLSLDDVLATRILTLADNCIGILTVDDFTLTCILKRLIL
jgi:hypothetical protein